MEVGIGIHGEPGRRREKIKSAKDIVEEVFTAIYNDIPYEKGDKVAVMVNGLGGTPISELYLLYREAAKKCEEKGLTIVKNYVGNYCTSLEMAGFSLTLVKLDGEIESLLNAPAEIPIRVF
jgi:dihydroxyacetone kinase-like protein